MRPDNPELLTGIAAALVPQVPAEIQELIPLWALVAVVSVMATFSVLEKLGRLPGGGLSGVDRQRLKDLHGTLLYKREDGVPRYIYHGQLLEALAKAEAERDQQGENMSRAVGLLVNQLETANRRLRNLERGMDERAKEQA